jgi:hypothetical protein
MGRVGVCGARGAPGRVGLGWVGLGRGPVWKPTTHTHTTTDRKQNANQNPKRGETDARLNTTSDKKKYALA